MPEKEKITCDDFKFVWAYMPLSEEEMCKIDSGHHIRPYLLCLEKEEYFYAFPCTSKVYKNKNRYQNSKVIVSTSFDYKSSLIDLSKIYILPKENIRSREFKVYTNQVNEIIKKILASNSYCSYPSELIEQLSKKETVITDNDLVESNGKLYNVVGFGDNNILYVLPVYKYPVNNTVEAETDGLKYYVDATNITCIKRDAVDKYCTQLFGFAEGHSKKTKRDLKKMYKDYSNMPKISTNKSYNLFCNLDPGMIISYEVNGIINKMIIVGNYGSDLEVLAGLDGEMYRDFKPMNLPSDINFKFEIVGCLNDERLDSLIDRSSYDYDKIYVKK